MSRSYSIRTGVLESFMILIALLSVYPLYFIVSMTFKTPAQMAGSPLSFPTSLSWSNYIETWKLMQFHLVLGNTVIITAGTVLLLTVLGSLASYPLARKPQKAYYVLFIYFIAGIMLPFQLAMVPLYRLVNELHLINTYYGAILIFTAVNLPLAVFLYSGFLRGTPKELEEAAKMDGCSLFRAFWLAVFPVIKPVTATVIVLCSLNTWNDLIIPLLFLQDQSYRTITIALYMFVGEHVTNWSLLFPGMVLSVLPLSLVYVFLQKFIIKGITAGSVKG
ncbi:carbohydrate ABC transporter permease [Paenibacillus sp. J5C_2022]|uniref:carbohydrate ABC transporter permease n=1 Tax=Paenibacillus sp. J5C2022 TaxID=2977129 RepID=UPI0021D0B553|nr:carbohydrate ABC transporter permease [Paenibacillus sp. J5C2022]MCU6711038.1 carbohydrate ABC transporter permease [Paenibacillus sp. J5C2022]